MRLFNRAKEEDGETEAAPEVHAGGEPGQAPVGVVPSPADGARAPGHEEETAVLDATVKEMSEKLTRLSSSLESVSTERAGFEEKIERMEDRMRKLSSLTEMLSAQYNPFIGDVPTERARLKAGAAEAGAGMAPLVPAPGKPADPSAPPADAEGSFGADADPEEASVADGLPGEPAHAVAHDPLQDEAHAETLPAEDAASAPAGVARGRVHAKLDVVRPGFMGNMLLLNWSNVLLKATQSRDGLRQVADYYHELGWIGESVRDALVAYAQGLACDEDEDERDWRGDVELHERSLLFIEKLKGGAP